jgi:hypothetical protein
MRRRALPRAWPDREGDEAVAFIGKPCDVASAHKAMRAADAALADKIPLTIAIFCAGAPNLNGDRHAAGPAGRAEGRASWSTCATAARAGRG